ncbi:MAG: flagellar biosynthesis protein [Novosphingobium sp.]|jgi:flagellar assembly protein FliH|nr:flagellar biosynthesis protein [Novosphingobium sp.]
MTNMSEGMTDRGTFGAGAFTAGAFQPRGFDTGGSGGFRSDMRFCALATPAPHAEPELLPEPEDPVAIAFSEGFAAGYGEAQEQAAEQARLDEAAREGLTLSFARLDRDLGEELRLRLRDTVAALCEAALAPLAMDEDALTRRIERAVAMLSRADDDRVIRLHPDDLALVAPRLCAEWQVVPDPALERGALRVETSAGGVEDGPDQWRRAIAEALHQC